MVREFLLSSFGSASPVESGAVVDVEISSWMNLTDVCKQNYSNDLFQNPN